MLTATANRASAILAENTRAAAEVMLYEGQNAEALSRISEELKDLKKMQQEVMANTKQQLETATKQVSLMLY